MFHVGTDDTPLGTPSIKMMGHGGCDSFQNSVNEWDFVRFGTIDSGEQIIASDPPTGVLNSQAYPGLDRFTVTFDSANYVYTDEVTVGVSGGVAVLPNVIQTRRRENTDPDTVEIVLDRPNDDLHLQHRPARRLLGRSTGQLRQVHAHRSRTTRELRRRRTESADRRVRRIRRHGLPERLPRQLHLRLLRRNDR